MVKNKEFWITNISNRNVTLSDLNLSVRAYSSVNLLDSKHYHYTEEQLNRSLESGSIFLKKNKIAKRIYAPQTIIKNNIEIDKQSVMPSQSNSIYEIKYEKYDELEVTDDEFAEQNIELSELDRQPLLSKDK